MIRPATHLDAEAIACIYNYYIEETTITFEETPVDSAEIIERMGNLDTGLPWFVDEEDGKVTAYAYAAPWRTRASYQNTVETTVYLDRAQTGRGLGAALYRELVKALEARSLHVLIGVLALPNPASIALHERLGFEQVAHFKEVGRKFDRWIDVGYWQLTIGG